MICRKRHFKNLITYSRNIIVSLTSIKFYRRKNKRFFFRKILYYLVTIGNEGKTYYYNQEKIVTVIFKG